VCPQWGVCEYNVNYFYETGLPARPVDNF